MEFSKPKLLNNIILTFVLIAGLGILAALAMGAFFALKPKFTKPSLRQRELINLRLPPKLHQGNEPKDTQNSTVASLSTTSTVHTTTQAVATTAKTEASANFAHLRIPNRENEVKGDYFDIHEPVVHPIIRFPQIVATTPLFLLQKPSTTTPTTTAVPPSVDDSTITASNIDLYQPKETGKTLERILLGYRKIAGIDYREGYLYVPSYVTGRVSVLNTPDMETLTEYNCLGCSIYDIAVLSTGEMVLVLGRQQQIVKLGPDGSEVKRIKTDFATKGVVANTFNEVFVLSRSHKEVYVFDANLDWIGRIDIPDKTSGDCNFLSVNSSDILFVSCQDAVYSMDTRGQLLYKLHPPPGVTYGVGIDVDKHGNILVVRRNQGVLDIYDHNGEYLEAVGESLDALWSDIAVGEDHLFVVNYIEAKIKVFRYS